MQDSKLLFFLRILRHSKELEFSAALDGWSGHWANRASSSGRGWSRFVRSHPSQNTRRMGHPFLMVDSGVGHTP